MRDLGCFEMKMIRIYRDVGIVISNDDDDDFIYTEIYGGIKVEVKISEYLKKIFHFKPNHRLYLIVTDEYFDHDKHYTILMI